MYHPHRHAYPLEIIATQNFYTINPEQIFTTIHFSQNYSRMEQSPNTEFIQNLTLSQFKNMLQAAIVN